MYVSEVKPGVVELRLVGFDVLRKVRMPRKAGGDFLKVPVALREDATAFVRDAPDKLSAAMGGTG